MCKINGRKLEEIRENAGMSQKELAEKLGVTPGTISHYENGDTNPSDEKLERLCMILKITDDDIKIQEINYSFTHGESKTVNNYRKRNKGKRYMNPVELEKFIQKVRLHPEEKEKAIIKSIRTKSTHGIGNKKFLLVEPSMIHIPTWQRDTDMAKVEEIRLNFDENKLDPIKVYMHNEFTLCRRWCA